MKIIDLLNKIANDEEVPKKIKIKDDELYFSKYQNTYIFEDGGNLNWGYYVTNKSLNDEVEIIEEDKKITKIELYEDSDGHYFYDKHCKKIYITCDEINFMFEQFNELIDVINNLKGSDEK